MLITLFLIVALAVLAIRLSHSEGQRSGGRISIGLLSIVLGTRTFVVLCGTLPGFADTTLSAQEIQPATTTVATERDRDLTAEVSSEAEMLESTESDSQLRAPTTAVSRTAPHTLTIEPKAAIKYLTLRPDWVETNPVLTGDIHQLAIGSGLHVRKRTAQLALHDSIRKALDTYVNDYLESPQASRLLNYEIEESHSAGTRVLNLTLGPRTFDIAEAPFEEQIEFEYGVMNQAHALVKLDPQLRLAFDQRWSEVRAVSRLYQTGLGAGAVLLVLATLFSYLRLATDRGDRTRRLRMGTAAAILATVALSACGARWITWM